MRVRKGVLSYIATAAIAVVLILQGVVASSPAPAGTIITNQARATYSDSNGTSFETLSNVVQTIVSLVPGVDISAGRLAVAKPGGSVTFAHLVSNTGNGPDRIAVNVGYTGSFAISIFIDLDSDGEQGPGDLLLSDTDGDGLLDTGLLLQGQALPILVLVQVPEGASLDTREIFPIEAVSANDPSVKDSTENVIEVDSAVPYLDLYGSPQFSYLGNEYEYSVSFGNIGDTSVEDALLEVLLPNGVDFVSASGSAAYDDIRRVVYWALGELSPSSSGSFTVRVKVVAAGAGITYVMNTARLFADDIVLEDSEPTGLVSGVPAFIFLEAEPKLVLGDGYSTSLLTAYVYDILGNPVPDGTLVEFRTELGRFRDNAKTYLVTTTAGGIATAVLVSPLMYGFEQQINLVTVVAGTPETGQATDQIEIVFSPGGIVGVVRDSQTGFPVTGVLVELVDSQGDPIFIARTDENGRYLLTAPAVGSFLVRIYTPGSDDALELPVEVLGLFGAIWSTDGAILGTILLDDAAGAAGIKASALQPLPSVSVRLYKNGILIGETVSDEQGDYMFSGLGIGDYQIVAVSQQGHTGYRAERIDQDGEVILNAIIEMYEQGLVYDRASGVPIPGAEVKLVYSSGPLAGQLVPLGSFSSLPPQENPGFADSVGRYAFFVPEGNYAVQARAFGYADALTSPIYLTGGVLNAYIPMDLIPSTAFALSKASDKSAAAPGERIRFTLTWSNISGGPLQGVVLKDMLPEGLIPDEATITAPGAYEPSTGTITWDYGTVSSSSAPVSVSFHATALETVPDGSEVVNRAVLTDDSENMAVASVSLTLAKKPDISISKQASVAKAYTGDAVTYRVIVSNSSDSENAMTANNASVADTIPIGFSYMPGSSYLEGSPAADPAISGRVLTWSLGDIEPGSSVQLIYKLSIGAGASSGDGINSAMLYGTGDFGYPFEEGPATARVLVAGPAFSELGSIIGKLWHDRNDNGIQEEGEEAIAGAEVMLDDGTRAVTDSEGQYHIGQVKPGLRSIKVNLSSLPIGMGMSPRLSDFIGGASSKFITVLPSSVVRADFALMRQLGQQEARISIEIVAPSFISRDSGDEHEVLVVLRNEGAVGLSEAAVSIAAAASTGSLKISFPDDELKVPELPAGAKVELRTIMQIKGALDEKFASILIGAAAFIPGSAGTGASAIVAQDSAASVVVASVVPAAQPGFRILQPEGYALSYLGHISVKTQAIIDVETELRVNGKLVPQSQIGSYTRDGINGISLIDYINVEISPGLNIIELVYPLTGKILATSHVLLPGSAQSAIAAALQTRSLRTVGAKVAVSALALDSAGLPAGNLAKVSFAAKGAAFEGRDIDHQAPGHQQKPGYFGEYELLLSLTSPDEDIYVSSSVGKNVSWTDLLPVLSKSSPGFAVGTLEISHNLSNFANSYLTGRFFYRKEISGTVLTFRYDPSQSIADGLFSDAGDDNLYNIYGDKALVQNAAPSSGPLYIKLQGKGFYAMWGDFQSSFEGLELTGMKAKLTGFLASVKAGGFLITGYAAPIGQKDVTDRIPANGTSGFFFLSEYPAIKGSETVYAVRVLYYDESTVIDRRQLFKGRDYQIDYAAGSILLSDALASYDDEGNRNMLEVSYKVYDEEVQGFYWGARAKATLGPITIGASASARAGLEDDLVVGAELGLDLGDAFRMSAEAAVSMHEYGYGGFALRAGAKSKLGRVELKAEASMTDGGFVRLDGQGPSPRGASLLLGAKLDDESRLILSITSLNGWKGTDYDYSSLNELKVGYRFVNPIPVTLGTALRYEFSEGGTEDTKGMAADAFLEVAPIKQLSIKAVAQLFKFGTVNDADGDFSISASYKPGSRLALVLTYSTGQKDDDRHHSLLLSADLAVSRSGNVYGKLSLPLGMPGKGNLISAGYKDAFTLAEGLRLSISVEAQTGLKLPEFFAPGTYRLAASASLDYHSSNGFKANLKQEAAYSSEGLTSLTAASLSGDATEWLALKADAAYYYGTSPTREGLPLKASAELSAAVRPDNTFVTGLLRVQGKYYAGEMMGRQELTGLLIASTDWNFELGRYFSFAVKAAYKMVAEGPVGYSPAFANTMLLQASGSLHLFDGTDLEGYIRSLGFAASWKTGYSAQVVQRIFNNMSIALGYNSKDLSDTDMPEGKPWHEGVYLKLLFKF